MTTLSDDFQYIVEEYGKPIGGEAVPEEVRDAYADRVPKAMLDFWKECGTGLWLDGYFQLCRPDQYQGLVDIILDGDPDFPPETSALLGFSAFGTLLIWNKKNRQLKLNLYSKYSYTDHVETGFDELEEGRAIATSLSSIDDKSFDAIERTAKAAPLFKRAKKKLGPLSYGECYGFVPARELGGLEILDEVHKRPAHAYFTMVAQLAPIQLRYFDLDKGKLVVLRNLGEG